MLATNLSRLLPALVASTLALALGACGGSDDTILDPDAGNGGQAAVADVTVLSTSVQVPSDGSVSPTITAIVRDANNNTVQGETVIFTADSGGLTVTNPTTDANGVAQATLSVLGDPTNRMITVSAQAQSTSGVTTVDVVGTDLTITGPDNLVQGDTQTYQVLLADASGSGIAGEAITIAADPGITAVFTGSGVTDTAGQVGVDVTGVSGGVHNLTASALNLTAVKAITVSDDAFAFVTPTAAQEIPLNTNQTVTVRWETNGVPQAGQTIEFTATRGVLSSTSAVTNGAGEATVTVIANNAGASVIRAEVAGGGPTSSVEVEFVATNPTSINVQADPFIVAPGEQSTVTAILRDAAGNLVKNQVVDFLLSDVTGGTISVQSVQTNSQGQAQTVYTASTVTSSANGVTIQATARGVAPALSGTVAITVARQQLFISLGTDNQILKNSDASYTKTYVLVVTDSEGGGVDGVTVQVGVLSDFYVKGFWSLGPFDDLWQQNVTAVCNDEDVNRNGILDPGEDFNASGNIEAGNVAAVVPVQVTTDSSGVASFGLVYAQSFAAWVRVSIKATARVQGSETEEVFEDVLAIATADIQSSTTPPGVFSPYGTSANCGDTL